MASAKQQSAREKFLAMIAAKKAGSKKKLGDKKLTRAETLKKLAEAKKGKKNV